MSASQWTTVISGIVDDPIFCHLCFICESLSIQLPNFYIKIIYKTSWEWKTWLHQICSKYNWSHTRSPLIWREIGISQTKVKYVGGVSRLWESLHKYNVTSCLTINDIKALKSDILYAYEMTRSGRKKEIKLKYRYITIIGAGKTICLDLVPQLIMTKELWLLNGVVINLYEEPGRFFKLKNISKDVKGIGGGLHAARVINDIQDGLHDCDILIYLDVLRREDCEDLDTWLSRNYNSMKELSQNINLFAPAHMKVLFCSMGPICFYANILQSLVSKLSKVNIVAVSAHYGFEIVHSLVSSLGFDSRNFGSPLVWGSLGINHFVDVHHMVQKCEVYQESGKGPVDDTKQPELRWSFYTTHNKNPYDYYFKRKAITQYQVGREEHFQECKAICDVLKQWYSQDKDIEDVITSLGITSDGTFDIPKGLVFSQPVSLKFLEDRTRVWVPCSDFPLPCMPISIFRNLIDTAVIITQRAISLGGSFL